MKKFFFFNIFLAFTLLCFFSSSFCASQENGASKEEKHYPALQVTLEGLPFPEESIVLNGLSIKNAEKEKRLDFDRIESLHQLAPQEISTLLEAEGYYHSQCQGSLQRTHTGFSAKYKIKLNAPTLIHSVVIELIGSGKEEPKLSALIEYPPLLQGNVLKHSIYETYKQNLLSKALQLGYLNAVFEKNEIRVNRKTHHTDIVLRLNTGQQYRMGKVTFKDPPYPDKYLERYIPFKPEASYTTEEINQLQKNLTESQLFRYVRIDPQLEDIENYQVPLKIRLKPHPKNRFFGGAGYGTDTGMRGILGWERRRQHYPGHKIQTILKASKRFNQFNVRYTIPGCDPITDRIVFGLRLTEEITRDKKYSRRGDLNATKIKRYGDIETVLDLNYLDELYRELLGTPKEHSHFLIPSVGLLWSIVKDCPQQTGFQIGGTLKGAAKCLFSTTSFIQGEVRAKWILPLGETGRLLLRSQFGATSAHNFNDIPISLRYYAGGDQSVRGYGYQWLGPRETDQFGNVVNVGGRYLAVGSIEIEKTIYKQYSGAVFMDAGNAMDKWSARIFTGVGFGIRYATPLGPLRVDIARALMPGKVKPRIHITFGMDL